jgi:hypothetical protein
MSWINLDSPILFQNTNTFVMLCQSSPSHATYHQDGKYTSFIQQTLCEEMLNSEGSLQDAQTGANSAHNKCLPIKQV